MGLCCVTDSRTQPVKVLDNALVILSDRSMSPEDYLSKETSFGLFVCLFVCFLLVSPFLSFPFFFCLGGKTNLRENATNLALPRPRTDYFEMNRRFKCNNSNTKLRRLLLFFAFISTKPIVRHSITHLRAFSSS